MTTEPAPVTAEASPRHFPPSRPVETWCESYPRYSNESTRIPHGTRAFRCDRIRIIPRQSLGGRLHEVPDKQHFEVR
jgi:hypothetical protein